ncbi:hypothetical protein N399_07385 [Bacillus licheniformis CG-B52]|nr:hypothetical protein N399_07385 [Bacillus licheniformis CG-B52]KUL13100.1 hypothetical protein LI17339_00220 [Bacillus licheniformis LMG 17339]
MKENGGSACAGPGAPAEIFNLQKSMIVILQPVP